jgi:hypothetical protein
VNANKVRVIYLAGSGRSGSTLLNRLLGTAKGVAPVGELHAIWQNGFMENHLCSCGVPFASCEYWHAVIHDAFGSNIDVARVWQLKNRLDHTRRIFQLWSPLKSARFQNDTKEYQEILERLYRSVAKVSGSSIIIDASKRPSTVLLISGIETLDVHLVHLVRDARAVVYAWQKKKPDPGINGYMSQHPWSQTMLFWLFRNLFAQLQRRRTPYTMVRYEDLIRQPRRMCENILQRSGFVDDVKLPFLSDNSIELPAIHMLSGNPGRFKSGMTILRLDEAWRHNLDAKTRRLVTLVTYPLLRHYGYCRT